MENILGLLMSVLHSIIEWSQGNTLWACVIDVLIIAIAPQIMRLTMTLVGTLWTKVFKILRKVKTTTEGKLINQLLVRLARGTTYPRRSILLQGLVIVIFGFQQAGYVLSTLLIVLIVEGVGVSGPGSSAVVTIMYAAGLQVGILGPVAWLNGRTFFTVYKAVYKSNLKPLSPILIEDEKDWLDKSTYVFANVLSLVIGIAINAVGAELISIATQGWVTMLLVTTHVTVSLTIYRNLNNAVVEWMFDLVYGLRTDLQNLFLDRVSSGTASDSLAKPLAAPGDLKEEESHIGEIFSFDNGVEVHFILEGEGAIIAIVDADGMTRCRYKVRFDPPQAVPIEDSGVLQVGPEEVFPYLRTVMERVPENSFVYESFKVALEKIE